jgi:hypothetical protein
VDIERLVSAAVNQLLYGPRERRVNLDPFSWKGNYLQETASGEFPSTFLPAGGGRELRQEGEELRGK